MLSIRNEQMESLRAEGFIALVREQLASRLLDGLNGQTPAEAQSLIRDSIEKAKAAGLTDGWDVYRYVEYQFRLGREYETRPEYAPVAEVLSSKDLGGGAKMDWLEYYYKEVLKPQQ